MIDGLITLFLIALALGINILIIRTIVHYSAKIFAEYIVDELEKRGKL